MRPGGAPADVTRSSVPGPPGSPRGDQAIAPSELVQHDDDLSLERELEELGSVGFIVVPQAHGRFAAQAARQFPDAQLLSAPFPSRRQRALPLRGELSDQPPPWPARSFAPTALGSTSVRAAWFGSSSSRTARRSETRSRRSSGGTSSGSPLATARFSSAVARMQCVKRG